MKLGLFQNFFLYKRSTKMNFLYRSSHQRCSLKKVFIKNFTKFTGKHLCWSLFLNKVSGLRTATLLKMRLQQRCFPVNFVKFLRTSFLQNTSQRLFLFVIHLTVSFCEEVLYIYSNLLLLEILTKTYNFVTFPFCKYILYSMLWMDFIDQNINTRNHVSLMRQLNCIYEVNCSTAVL